MTANQIAYARLKEDRRHNVVSEDINSGNLQELKRHNYAQEVETNRSNVVRETETALQNQRDVYLQQMKMNNDRLISLDRSKDKNAELQQKNTMKIVDTLLILPNILSGLKGA